MSPLNPFNYFKKKEPLKLTPMPEIPKNKDPRDELVGPEEPISYARDVEKIKKALIDKEDPKVIASKLGMTDQTYVRMVLRIKNEEARYANLKRQLENKKSN